MDKESDPLITKNEQEATSPCLQMMSFLERRIILQFDDKYLSCPASSDRCSSVDRKENSI